MEKISTKCPNCRVRMKVNSKFIGRQAKCPECSVKFTIQPIQQEGKGGKQQVSNVPPNYIPQPLTQEKNENSLARQFEKLKEIVLKTKTIYIDQSKKAPRKDLVRIYEGIRNPTAIIAYKRNSTSPEEYYLIINDHVYDYQVGTPYVVWGIILDQNLEISAYDLNLSEIEKLIVLHTVDGSLEGLEDGISSYKILFECSDVSEPFPNPKKEDFRSMQELLQKHRKTLKFFHNIITERSKAERSAKEEFVKIAQDLVQKRGQMLHLLNQAKETLKSSWDVVLTNTSIPSNIDNQSVLGIDHYIEQANEILQEIHKLRYKPLSDLGEIGGLTFGVWAALSIFNLIWPQIKGGWIFSVPISIFIIWKIKAFLFIKRQSVYMEMLQTHADAERSYKIRFNKLKEKHEARNHQMEGKLFEDMNKIERFVQHCHQQIDSLSPQWSKRVWKNFILPTNIPPVTRMGYLESEKNLAEQKIAENNPSFSNYHTNYQYYDENRNPVEVPWDVLCWGGLAMPILFPFPGKKSVLFKVTSSGNKVMTYGTNNYYNGDTYNNQPQTLQTVQNSQDSCSQTVAKGIQALLLRLLATIPPGKLRFTFIDPVSLGQNVAPFMHLADYDEALVNSKAWSEPKHIEQRLAELTEHMENVIQKYLRDTYETIEEFNEQAGEVAEAYRFLVVMNFPVNFTEDAARRLVSIIQNGPRCGVHTVILYDTEQQLPYGFNASDLEQFSMVISWDGKQLIWDESDLCRCRIQLDRPPKEEIFNKIVNRVGKVAVEASKVEVPFEKILEKANLSSGKWWKGNSASGIQAPLGPIGANKVQLLDLGKGTAQHALIAGKTGSGKSTLLHVFISTLALDYSPDELELYLIDFKKGIGFKRYATHQLPHARVIAIESEREFGLSVLEGLDVELKQRGDLFRSAEVDGLKEYRQRTEKKMPRILLLVDEFQEFFTEDDAVASRVSQILDRLVRQGRAFGIHVLLGSQTLAGAYSLARSTIDQMAIRIALQCSEADSRLILSDDNPAARLLSRPGEAIYNSANGLIEGNNPFQVAWLSDEKQAVYLKKIAVLAKKIGQWPPKKLIVFEGNAPANAGKNRHLAAHLLKASRSASPRKASAWLGEPIAIREATMANFRRQSGGNLLIMGQNDEAVMGMLQIALVSLSAQYTSKAAIFYFLDFGSVDVPHAHFLNALSEVLPHQTQYGKRRHLPNIISTIAQEVESRLEHEDEGLEKKPSIYLTIYGVQRARDLEQDEELGGGFSFDMPDDTPKSPSPGKLFPKIVRDGPDLGIHTILWCDTYNNLQRRLSRQILREFEMKVVLQMSNEDSMTLIDSPAASKLGQHRALFYSEEEGRLEKFRPFALPEERWLKLVSEKLKSTCR